MPRVSIKLGVLAASACLLASQTASAHVAFLAEPGLVLTPGKTVTLEWVDTIPHDTLGYDLELYTDLNAAPESIVSGLGSDVHSYAWVVPDVVCSDCRLRVLQDNSGADYEGFLSVQIGNVVLGAGGEAGTDTTSATTGGADLTTSASAGGATSTNSASSAGHSTTGVSTTTGASAADGSMGPAGSPAKQSSTTQSSDGCTLANPVPDSGAWPLVALLGLGLFAVRRTQG
jgi:hypothetical protein